MYGKSSNAFPWSKNQNVLNRKMSDKVLIQVIVQLKWKYVDIH